MSSAAPLPRPPQPTSPTLIVSLPAAWALVNTPRPIVAAVEVLRKSRREAGDAFSGLGSVMLHTPVVVGSTSLDQDAFRSPSRVGQKARETGLAVDQRVV